MQNICAYLGVIFTVILVAVISYRAFQLHKTQALTLQQFGKDFTAMASLILLVFEIILTFGVCPSKMQQNVSEIKQTSEHTLKNTILAL